MMKGVDGSWKVEMRMRCEKLSGVVYLKDNQV